MELFKINDSDVIRKGTPVGTVRATITNSKGSIMGRCDCFDSARKEYLSMISYKVGVGELDAFIDACLPLMIKAIKAHNTEG